MIVRGYVSDAGGGVITIVVDGEEYPAVGDVVEVHVIEEPATREESFVEGFVEGRE